MSKEEYVLQWIKEIAPKLAPLKTFEEWIKGFEARYGESLLNEMKKVWDQYR